MKNSELRALRMQLVMVGVLLAGALALGATLVGARSWVEPLVCERFRTPYEKFPAALKQLADALANEHVDSAALAALSSEEKNLLFEDWIARREPRRPLAPRHLMRADAAFFLQRIERCVVSGNSQQRQCAVEFLVLARDDRSLPIIDALERWASDRRMRELAASLSAARDTIEAGTKPPVVKR